MNHELKTWPGPFADVRSYRKNFEVRKDDRNFQIGDCLILEEWDPDTEKYTGDMARRTVGYKLLGGQFGIEDGYCVLGFVEIAF